MKHLVVIGAGPKAMAIAAKNAVLRSLGYGVPEVHVVERRAVGANWSGDFGFTDGKQPLGTSPEKDVGFPFDGSAWGSQGREVSRAMAAYSWQSFLVATDRYSDWIDRGRPAPEHRVWAEYLKWVSIELKDQFHLHCGEVTGLAARGAQWEVTYRTPTGETVALPADGVVFTGPARQRLPGEIPVSDRILTVESFWKNFKRFETFSGQLAIVGTGENAASISATLAGLRNLALRVTIVSPRGMVYSRGEGFHENRVYSNPAAGNWESLSIRHRREFIYRTDRSVFSLQAQRTLDSLGDFSILPGRVKQIRAEEKDRITLDLEYRDGESAASFDYVVLATGADPLRFLNDLCEENARAQVTRALEGATDTARVESRIGRDLAIDGLTPRLHFPMLAGMTQGPGFANLSCLGRLSDRILSSYVEER